MAQTSLIKERTAESRGREGQGLFWDGNSVTYFKLLWELKRSTDVGPEVKKEVTETLNLLNKGLTYFSVLSGGQEAETLYNGGTDVTLDNTENILQVLMGVQTIVSPDNSAQDTSSLSFPIIEALLLTLSNMEVEPRQVLTLPELKPFLARFVEAINSLPNFELPESA